MITNMHTNIMGTLSFDAKFKGMRKAQDFIVYPMHEVKDFALIQSKTRIGQIHLETGVVVMSNPHPNGAYGHHLAEASRIETLDAATLLLLKANIMGTASGKAGTNGVVYTDNSGALGVFK
jgi:hypothetical protein